MDKSADTNRTRMEHLSLSDTAIGLKDLAIVSERLGNKLIAEANQASASIDRRGHSDQGFSFRSQKSGNKMSVDFERNADEKLEWKYWEP